MENIIDCMKNESKEMGGQKKTRMMSSVQFKERRGDKR
jgi:hypothetical protein